MLQAIKENDATKLVEELKLVYTNAISESSSNSTNSEKTTLERMKTLLQASLTIVNNQIAGLTKLDAVSVANSTGRIILEVDNIQCFEPRGRFNLKVTSTNIFLEGKQFSVLIPVESIAQIMCLPSFTSAKKEGEDYLAFHLKDSVKINNKESKQLLLNLLKIPNPSLRMNNTNDILTESNAIILAIQEATNLSINRPQTSLFSTVRENKSYLKCYRGTQEGAIYPLQCGIVFIKPLLYIPTEEIASLSAGRGGGAGNTRYVDLIIETAHEKNHEFTNIDRDELPAVQQYVKGYLETRALKQQQQQQQHQLHTTSNNNSNKQIKDENQDDNSMIIDSNTDNNIHDSQNPDNTVKNDNGTDLYVTDSSDESDEDYDPNDSDSDDSGYKRRKSKHYKHDNNSDNSGSGSENSDSDGSSGSGSGSDSEEYESDASDCSGDHEIIMKKPTKKQLKEGVEDSKEEKEVKESKVCTTSNATSNASSSSSSSSSSSTKPTIITPATATSTTTSATNVIKAVPGQPIKRHIPSTTTTTSANTATIVKTEVTNSSSSSIDVKSECSVVNSTTATTAPAAATTSTTKEGRKKSVPIKKESTTATATVVSTTTTTNNSTNTMKVTEVGESKTASRTATTGTTTTADIALTVENNNNNTTSIVPSENTNTTNTSATTSTVTGVKRTIKDMFAAQNKKKLSEKDIIVADLTEN